MGVDFGAHDEKESFELSRIGNSATVKAPIMGFPTSGSRAKNPNLIDMAENTFTTLRTTCLLSFLAYRVELAAPVWHPRQLLSSPQDPSREISTQRPLKRNLTETKLSRGKPGAYSRRKRR